MTSRILIKIGGLAFEGENGFKDLAQAIRSIQHAEIIIVHGGGAEISQALKDADRESVFIDGIRITQAEDIKIVENVLSETINRRISGWLSENGVPCSSMSGKTKRLFMVELLRRQGHDFGFVGKIRQSYNVNADSAAAALAAAARCSDLVFITDVPGVLVEERICRSLTVQKAKALIADSTIKGGMVAKMESAFEALDNKVPRVHIVQWQGPGTLENIITGNFTTGTTIHK
ncbi:MAG: acetylglutamate kinase [Deltaproteobacteria bacterium]|nr:acetylglutamate kinase [Deltaproteobacteria bacterium]